MPFGPCIGRWVGGLERGERGGLNELLDVYGFGWKGGWVGGWDVPVGCSVQGSNAVFVRGVDIAGWVTEELLCGEVGGWVGVQMSRRREVGGKRRRRGRRRRRRREVGGWVGG